MRVEKEYFRGRKVTVVGLARTGLAAANLLQRLGAEVLVSDIKPEKELRPLIEKLHPGVNTEFGGHGRNSLVRAQTVVVSPGVPWDLPVLIRSRGSGTEVISEIELGFRLTETPLIAVTGTNGKSTTTVLIGEMFKVAGKVASVGGNLGRPLVEMVEEKGLDFMVVEVSSFQLEGIDSFKPHIAVMLNISPDHLDRHGNMKNYLKAKKRIYRNMEIKDLLVVNGDQDLLADFGEGCRAQRAFFSRRSPLQAGAWLMGDRLMLRCGEKEEEIIDVDRICIGGAHNLENCLAASAAAAACGVDSDAMRRALQNFQGLEHRLESVRTLDGVLYVNDSKGTNVDAAVKSIVSFQNPVILIAGGKDKGGDYDPLKNVARGKVKMAVLMGEARDKIAAAIGRNVETTMAADMQEAVRLARAAAEPGDVILLSPACSSFDMFTDFEERGMVFKRAVDQLSEEKAPL